MESPLIIKSKAFSLEVIKVCNEIRQTKHESVLTNQFLRSGTSIGANIIFEIEKSLMFGDKYYFHLNGYRIQIPEYPEPVDCQLINEDSLEKFIQGVVEEIQNMTIY